MPELQSSAPHAAPQGFVPHVYRKTFTAQAPRSRAWAWLCDPATFTESQIWPYRVEFVDPDTHGPGGFEEGVLTVHHGPLINFAGILTAIRAEEYRDLQYFYGSYALSLRLIRPTRLQFWLDDAPDGHTTVRLQLDSFVRPALRDLWTAGQKVFWDRFPRWMNGALSRSAR